MSNRKETPDLLGDILSPAPVAPSQDHVALEPASKPRPKPKTNSATRSRAAKPATIQWEYREVIFREFRGWRPRFVDGEELENWREQPEIKTYLAVLGTEGWEMVGIMENKRNTRSIYFKRPQG